MTLLAQVVAPVVSILANFWLLYLSVKWMRRYGRLAEEHFKLRIEMVNVESDLWWERHRKDLEAAALAARGLGEKKNA